MFKENSQYHRVSRIFILNIWQKLLQSLPRLTKKRRVLFITESHLMEYLVDVWNLLRTDEELYFRSIEIYQESEGSVRRKEQLGDIIRARLAYLCKWDLVITTNHPSSIVTKDFCNKEYWPTLRIQHGIMGKKVDGRAHAYSKYAYDSSGRIMYSCIFASSEYEKKIAVGYDQEYNRVVKVVGSLQDDQLLDLMQQRSTIRNTFGIKDEEVVVFIVSTWGQNCLFRRWGTKVINEALKIKDKYRFIISIHPLEYGKNPAGKEKLEQYFKSLAAEGFLIREPQEDWKKYLIACDLIITDHTALSAHGALIKRPFVYVPIPDDIVEPESPISLLKNISPKLRDDAQDLQDKIQEALNDYPYGLLDDVAKAINSYPGESKKRINEEIYHLLKLAPPE
jgi:hypothetical protein